MRIARKPWNPPAVRILRSADQAESGLKFTGAEGIVTNPSGVV